MTPKARMRCTKCGGEMNHHAEKLIITAATQERGYDPALSGYVEENHACPNCGNVDARRAI